MTDYIDDGRVWISDSTSSNYLKVKSVEPPDATPIRNPLHTHYVGGDFSLDMGQQYWQFKIKRIHFDTYAKLTTFMTYITTWQEAASPFNLEVVRDSSNNKIAFDGTNTKYSVRMPKNGIGSIRQVGYGDIQRFEISLLVLESG